jgi:hypothetical protein
MVGEVGQVGGFPLSLQSRTDRGPLTAGVQWIFTDFIDWTDLGDPKCRGGGTVVGRVVLAWELKTSC